MHKFYSWSRHLLLSESDHHLTPSNVTSKLTILPHRNTHHLATSRRLRFNFFNSSAFPKFHTLHHMNRPSRSTVTRDAVGLFLVWLIWSSMSSMTPVTRSPNGMMPLPTYLLISSSLIPNAYTDHSVATDQVSK